MFSVYESSEAYALNKVNDNKSAVVIGKFDAFHYGHQQILNSLLSVAKFKKISSVLFTFKNNPLSIIKPDSCPNSLLSSSQKIIYAEKYGLENVIMPEFDEKLSLVSAEDFIEKFLLRDLNLEHLFIGKGFRFGNKGIGDIDLLYKYSDKYGFDITEIPAIKVSDIKNSEYSSDLEYLKTNSYEISNERISASLIRDLISQGRVALANYLLNYRHTISSKVVRGHNRGKELGFPTANLSDHIEGFIPGDGVYAAFVYIGDSRIKHLAAVSVGTNPTFNDVDERIVEAYILDFDQDIYSQNISVEFVDKIRDMFAFSSIGDLISAMNNDIVKVGGILNNVK